MGFEIGGSFYPGQDFSGGSTSAKTLNSFPGEHFRPDGFTISLWLPRGPNLA